MNDSNLNTLKILHFVYGGLCLLGSLFGVLYIAFGTLFLAAGDSMANGSGEPPPAIMGGIFLGFGIVMFVLILAYGIVNILAGKYIGQRRGWVFTLVVSGLNCLNMPLGTGLAIFTIIVMLKPEVKQEFGV